MSEFIEKVSRIQAELKAPKNRKNSFGGYMYRSCEDILEAVKPLCKENGLVLTLTDTPKDLNGWHYIEATARKYALNGLFLIDDAKDADTDENAMENNLNVHSLAAIKTRLNQAITSKMDEGFSVKEIAQLTGVGKDEEDVRDIIRMIGKIDTFEKSLKSIKR